MLTNNIELDLKTRMIEEGVTQTEIAEGLGVSIPFATPFRITHFSALGECGHRSLL